MKSRFYDNNAQANQARALETRALRELHFFCPCEGDWRAISFYWVGLTPCLSEEQFPRQDVRGVLCCSFYQMFGLAMKVRTLPNMP